jgi:hypothetical protein
MVYEAARNRTVLFGGSDAGGAYLDDTWTWDGTQWHQIDISGPAPRDHHGMAYDGQHSTVVLFGGWDGTYLGDTWAWDGAAWTLATEAGPSARGGKPALVYDSQHASVLLYGGGNEQQQALQDLWAWDGTEWHLTYAPADAGESD